MLQWPPVKVPVLTVSRRTVVGALALSALSCRRPVPGRDRALVLVFGPQHAPANADALRARLESSSKLKLELRVAKSSDEAVDLIQSGGADGALPATISRYSPGIASPLV